MPELVDLRGWPALREVAGKFQPHRGLLASAVAANGVHAWIEQGPDGIASTPYAHLPVSYTHLDVYKRQRSTLRPPL